MLCCVAVKVHKHTNTHNNSSSLQQPLASTGIIGGSIAGFLVLIILLIIMTTMIAIAMRRSRSYSVGEKAHDDLSTLNEEIDEHHIYEVPHEMVKCSIPIRKK